MFSVPIIHRGVLALYFVFVIAIGRVELSENHTLEG
jgi:hypothetical protein